MTLVTLTAHFPGDGGDPLEIDTDLPFVPRRGDELAIWVKHPTGGYPEFFEVAGIVVDIWNKHTSVILSTNGHTPAEVQEAFAAYRAEHKP